jgi:phospholipid/cholesterol/gamma-HCH transport system substrate-binding protein
MATLKTKFSVGLFLICGIAILILGIIWLGMSNYLEKGSLYVAYFDESVQGLDVDSPVKYRGVHIGRVHSIGVAPDERLIEVVVKIESDLKPEGNAKELIAKLKSVGITGLMFIELEHEPSEGQVQEPTFAFTPEYPVIPTRPSEISKFFQGIDDVFNMFRSIDTLTISNQVIAILQKINRTFDEAQFAQLAGELRTTVKNLQRFLDTEQVRRTVASLEKTSQNFNRMVVNADDGISQIRATAGRLDGLITGSGDDIQQVTADLRVAAQEVKQAMESAAVMLEGADRNVDVLQRQAGATLGRIEQAADSLNRLLDHLANQPSQVIFSAPAPDKP